MMAQVSGTSETCDRALETRSPNLIDRSAKPWNGVIYAKAELEEAWFRVSEIPYDKRSLLTLGYVGSLVDVTREVEEMTLLDLRLLQERWLKSLR
jgi:hypothetical protein